VPHIILLGLHNIWNGLIRPARDTNVDLNNCASVALIILVNYFFVIEVMQMRVGWTLYKKQWLWNLVDMFPLFAIMLTVINCLSTTSMQN